MIQYFLKLIIYTLSASQHKWKWASRGGWEHLQIVLQTIHTYCTHFRYILRLFNFTVKWNIKLIFAALYVWGINDYVKYTHLIKQIGISILFLNVVPSSVLLKATSPLNSADCCSTHAEKHNQNLENSNWDAWSNSELFWFSKSETSEIFIYDMLKLSCSTFNTTSIIWNTHKSWYFTYCPRNFNNKKSLKSVQIQFQDTHILHLWFYDENLW